MVSDCSCPPLPPQRAPVLDGLELRLLARMDRLLMEVFNPSVIPAHDCLVQLQRAVRRWLQHRKKAAPKQQAFRLAKPIDLDALAHLPVPRAPPVSLYGLQSSFSFRKRDSRPPPLIQAKLPELAIGQRPSPPLPTTPHAAHPMRCQPHRPLIICAQPMQ